MRIRRTSAPAPGCVRPCLFRRFSALSPVLSPALALVLTLACGMAALTGGCVPRQAGQKAAGLSTTGGKPATAATTAANAAVSGELDFSDRQDFADARRGFIAPLPNRGRIAADRPGAGKSGYAWNLEPYAFLTPAMSRDAPASVIMPMPAPDTVHPALWRQSQLVMVDGLYKVTDRIYQVRNADLSNMTIIEGHTGLIVVDPLVSAETARASLDLYYAHRPHKPVKTLIYSHSHVDHYGGAEGVVSAQDVRRGKVRVIAPQGFLEAALAENVLAGNAMGRRAQYMYGNLLPPGPDAHVGAGLGLKTSEGAVGLVPPTETVTTSGQRLNIDGLTFIFQMAPGTEAPAEMHWYIPQLKALTTAENCTHTMHNLYTLRGAKTRDPLSWSRALDETLQRWGDEAEVLYSMHHWPVWGGERVRQTLAQGRDLYRYIHDQTLRLANMGQNMTEIAESLRLPPELARNFALRGYYGSLNHNVKAVYNFYLGWFDGNPARLHPLPPTEAARKYMEYMGGAEAVLKRARQDFAAGRYRWVAQVLDMAVFADPTNRAARELEADALEQLGYQAESGPWRNFYLSGARDLRGAATPPTAPQTTPQAALDGATPPAPAAAQGKISGQQAAMPPQMFFDYLAVRLNGPKAQGHTLLLRVRLLPEAGQLTEEEWNLDLSNSVLHAHRAAMGGATPQATITGPKPAVMALFAGKLPLEKAEQRGMVAGDAKAVAALLALLETFSPDFNLVLP